MSCLFQSLGHLIGQDATALREQICNYLTRNPDLMDGANAETVIGWDSGMTMDDYVRSMRSRSTWGGGVEIAAFVNMTGKAVVVRHLGSNKEIVFVPKQGRPVEALFISYTGSHYEPLQKKPI